jgi:hypothetical protein
VLIGHIDKNKKGRTFSFSPLCVNATRNCFYDYRPLPPLPADPVLEPLPDPDVEPDAPGAEEPPVDLPLLPDDDEPLMPVEELPVEEEPMAAPPEALTPRALAV